MRFKPGQEVVCLKSAWEQGGPKKGEICTVDGHSTFGPHTFLYLAGYTYDNRNTHMRIDFNEVYFSPVADISELQEVLQAEHQV